MPTYCGGRVVVTSTAGRRVDVVCCRGVEDEAYCSFAGAYEPVGCGAVVVVSWVVDVVVGCSVVEVFGSVSAVFAELTVPSSELAFVSRRDDIAMIPAMAEINARAPINAAAVFRD